MWPLPDFHNTIGLPCLLCGGTRAMHFILHGEFQQALYYNWLAFPALLVAAILALVMCLEVARQRVLLPIIRFNTSRVVVLVLVLASLWAQHVYDALSSPKPELLNQRGLFFRLISTEVFH